MMGQTKWYYTFFYKQLSSQGLKVKVKSFVHTSPEKSTVYIITYEEFLSNLGLLAISLATS